MVIYEKCEKCKEKIFIIKKVKMVKGDMIANLVCSKCKKLFKFPENKLVTIRTYDN